MKHITLDDIAARLALSKYSVSRALSGKSGVSEMTRKSVLHTAQELGYKHPAVLGQSKPLSEGNIILLIPYEDLHDSEFWMEVISGAETEAEKLGFGLITRPLSNQVLKSKPSLKQVQGFIVAGSKARAALADFLNAEVPVVLITYPEPLEQVDTVTIGDWEGSRVAAQHLIDLGHRYFGFVTDRPSKPSNQERFRGLREMAHMHPEIHLISFDIGSDDPSVAFEKAYASIKEPAPTAIIASTDSVAFNVILALNRLGLSVPRDVSVVGFNDSIQASQFVPKLTTLRVPKTHIGLSAMQSLYRRIQSKSGYYQRLSLPPEFILRESTGSAPG